MAGKTDGVHARAGRGGHQIGTGGARVLPDGDAGSSGDTGAGGDAGGAVGSNESGVALGPWKIRKSCDECDPNATCKAVDDAAYCFCDRGYRGDGATCTEITACDCKHGGTCTDYDGQTVCDCPMGLGGEHCEIGIKELAAGEGWLCALRTDGTIRCAGASSQGQAEPPSGTFTAITAALDRTYGITAEGTSTGTTFPGGDWYIGGPTTPKVVAIATNDTTRSTCTLDELGTATCSSGIATADQSLVARGDESCSLHGDGSVSCWGSSSENPSGAFLSIAVGGGSGAPFFGCGIRLDHTLECWGDGASGLTSPPAGTFTTVAAGAQHACALDSDGRAQCWGDNSDSQAPPTNVTFDAIAAGDGFTCGIDSGGTIACWGRNDSGQASPPGGSFIELSLGAAHGCGLHADKSLECWGLDDAGQAAPPTGTFTSVTAGRNHTCAIGSDGWGYCFGDDEYGESTFPVRPAPIAIGYPAVYLVVHTLAIVAADGRTCAVYDWLPAQCWGNNAGGPSSRTQRPFTTLSLGGEDTHEYACGVRSDGSLRCLGGLGYPAAVPPPGHFKEVAAGRTHTCAIRSDDTLSCWDTNTSGEATPPSGTFTRISASDDFNCGLRTDGTLACWGRDSPNQYVQDRTHPPSGTFTTLVTRFSGGCAVRTEGDVACWGSFDPATLPKDVHVRAVSAGDGRVNCALDLNGEALCGSLPTIGGPFVALAPGRIGACGLRPNGIVRCWPWRDSYATIPSPSGTFIAIASGGYSEQYGCGIRSDGTLACWGSGAPEGLPSGRFTDIAVGTSHGCALRRDDTVACWGSEFSEPVPSPDGEYKAISAMESTTCALRSDGRLACWDISPWSLGPSNNVVFDQPFASYYSNVPLACGLTNQQVWCFDRGSDTEYPGGYDTTNLPLTAFTFSDGSGLGIDPTGKLIGFGEFIR